MNNPRILFAGGGTGGHIYPALSIADAIKAIEPGAAIEFAGTQDRMEWKVVPKNGYAIHPITVSGFHRGELKRNLLFPFKLLRGLWQSWNLVKHFDADVVVGTGGFVAGPVLFAASLRGRPIVLQEQNAHAGVTNKLLAKRASEIHIAFEGAKNAFPEEKCVLNGNPTRPELQKVDEKRAEARAHWGIPEGVTVVLMFGGSLGSLALNNAMEAHHAALLADERIFLIWQTGARYYERLTQRIQEHPRLRLLQYIDRMDLAYAAADIALCRSGAITCSELMVTGTPSILVPSPNVAEDHQTKNAESMAEAKAASLLPEARLDAALVNEVRTLVQDPTRRTQMRTAARSIARPDAAHDIATSVLQLAQRRR